MYYNLANVLKAENYSTKFIAEFLGVTEKSVNNKIKGITCFTLPEYKRICNLLNKYEPGWLFTSESDNEKTA